MSLKSRINKRCLHKATFNVAFHGKTLEEFPTISLLFNTVLEKFVWCNGESIWILSVKKGKQIKNNSKTEVMEMTGKAYEGEGVQSCKERSLVERAKMK